MTDRELAESVGVSDRLLKRWRAAGMTAQTVDGVQAWREENRGTATKRARGGVGANGEPPPTWAEELLAKRRAGVLLERDDIMRLACAGYFSPADVSKIDLAAKAIDRMRKIDEARGDTVRVDEIRSALSAHIASANTRLGTISKRAAPDIATRYALPPDAVEVIRGVIEGYVREVADELARDPFGTARGAHDLSKTSDPSKKSVTPEPDEV